MFKRVIHEEWATIVPMFAFAVMFTVFVVTTLRAIRLKPDERKRMADLPLQDSNDSEK
ncbi:hypothetical protein [Luteolibacter marinus]|uniref:hypothetical protein n=1 Tax=Luteolibacter marinus TaxID=2776705 RepID=UPI0018686AAD|nr:hypothetical protein [Luteolibacter marinus]